MRKMIFDYIRSCPTLSILIYICKCTVVWDWGSHAIIYGSSKPVRIQPTRRCLYDIGYGQGKETQVMIIMEIIVKTLFDNNENYKEILHAISPFMRNL